MATMADFSVVRGDSVAIPITFVDGRDETTPIPVDGYSLHFTAKITRYDPEESAAIDFEVVLPDEASNGEYVLMIAPGLTKDLDPLTYDYDIQLVSPDGQTVYTVVQGRLKLTMSAGWEN